MLRTIWSLKALAVHEKLLQSMPKFTLRNILSQFFEPIRFMWYACLPLKNQVELFAAIFEANNSHFAALPLSFHQSLLPFRSILFRTTRALSINVIVYAAISELLKPFCSQSERMRSHETRR